MDDRADVVIVGGGIIGCSVALELARRRRFQEVFLLERGLYLGDGTSTRNSYVIHAGIHYPEDSLKAKFCLAGNRDLYRFCERHRIPCLKIGKLIVALRESDLPGLERLLAQGTRNGVPGLKILDRADLRRLEPEVDAVAALHSPETGVFDVAQWFRVVEALLYENGAQVLKKTPVVGLEPEAEGVRVVTSSRGSLPTRFAVNAAGLFADEVGNLLGNRFRIHPIRGDYFVIRGRKAALINGAVYPTPGSLGLGIHLTRLWDGTLLVGPDARRVQSKENYRPLPVLGPDGDLDEHAEDVERFFDEVRTYFPAIAKSDLQLSHCGIRPSLLAPGETGFRDFRIAWDASCPCVIHLLGIDSPGLTSAPAIARHVADMIEGRAAG
jgi:glycerol-3-phosphate dehydrogenase